MDPESNCSSTHIANNVPRRVVATMAGNTSRCMFDDLQLAINRASAGGELLAPPWDLTRAETVQETAFV